MADAARPDWDMKPFFAAPEAPDYDEFVVGLRRDLTNARATAEAMGVPDASTNAQWIALLELLEDVHKRFAHVGGYLNCLAAADSSDEGVQREVAALAPLRAELSKAQVAVRAALRRAADADVEALLAAPELSHAGYFLRRMRELAHHAMEPELEGLAADLGVTGISAWGRLYTQVSSKLTFELDVPGQSPRRVPASMTRTLLEDRDPDVRRAALRGSNRAWQGVGDTVAACLNAISGTRLALCERRGAQHFLEPALFAAAISRDTLDTMLAVVRERQPLAHRYLVHKARLLGKSRLGFQDVNAPLPTSNDARVSWPDAREQVLTAFGKGYPALQELAARAFDAHWIDHSPRDAKRPGGFCSSSPLIGQSRIFMTFNGARGDVRTLAHELGHAFHAWVMRDLRPWQRVYPMTLAETASTFAEQLVTDAVIESAAAPESARLAVLDQQLAHAATFLCNIPMRFDFEHEVYTRRASRELGVKELCAIMLDKQRTNFGDALDPDQLDPWYWASKLHFYLSEISFYNFPYTFGYLFSLGIFALAKQEGPAFLPRYEALLRATGSGTAEDVARQTLGIDLTTPPFWHASVDRIESDLNLFIQST